MEDPNMLAADCLVISCCCQCLILQILVFVLLKVPYKLVRKTKEYAKKKLMHRKRGDEKIIQRGTCRCEDVFIGLQGGSGGIQVESFATSECHGYGCCMEEVEKVLEELSQKGVFAFGSFWGRENSESSSSTCLAKQEFDYNVVQYHLIEIVGPF